MVTFKHNFTGDKLFSSSYVGGPRSNDFVVEVRHPNLLEYYMEFAERQLEPSVYNIYEDDKEDEKEEYV